MITYLTYDDRKKKVRRHKSFTSRVWAHAENPTDEEKKFLSKKFKIDPGHINDVLDINEVPRFEIEGETLYVFIRFPQLEEAKLVTLPFLVVIGKTSVVTVSLNSRAFFDESFEKKITFDTSDREKVLLLVLSKVTTLYNFHLNSISKGIRQIRSKIENIKNKDIVQFVAFEEILNDFKPSLMGTNSVLTNFMTGKFLAFDKEERDMLEDIHLSNRQLVERCQDTLDSIKNIREGYTTILTNNLNKVIKLFTSVTVILTIPTMIASLYGMNVTLPFAEYPGAFMGILVLIIVIIVGLLWLFQKNDWF